MGILASDTSAAAERVQLEILRAMPPVRKAAILSATIRAGLGLKDLRKGAEVIDPFDVTAEVVSVLDGLGVDYFVGGSIASALHGEPRYTQDADLVVRLEVPHLEPLVAALQEHFYVSDTALKEAIRRRTSANLVHFESAFKVDLMISKERPFEKSRFRRRLLMPAGAHQFWVASAEDMVLVKLEWFRLGGEVSEKQWRDVLALLLTSAQDRAYLSEWSEQLGVSDLLQRAWTHINTSTTQVMSAQARSQRLISMPQESDSRAGR
ncbi:MAG: hypothetical protein KF760_07200 [Candidatus Eremiobacteraeota bacterium]|nr:hypothetical protein [Candidatus Eremiobacteraeota bacterium]MCW5869213.1 hypothetical protein [Candidatus Eremiobacteraeota bacterium]